MENWIELVSISLAVTTGLISPIAVWIVKFVWSLQSKVANLERVDAENKLKFEQEIQVIRIEATHRYETILQTLQTMKESIDELKLKLK